MKLVSVSSSSSLSISKLLSFSLRIKHFFTLISNQTSRFKSLTWSPSCSWTKSNRPSSNRCCSTCCTTMRRTYCELEAQFCSSTWCCEPPSSTSISSDRFVVAWARSPQSTCYSRHKYFPIFSNQEWVIQQWHTKREMYWFGKAGIFTRLTWFSCSIFESSQS